MGSFRGVRRVSLRRRGAEARHAVAGQNECLMMWNNVEDLGATVGSSVFIAREQPVCFASAAVCEE